MFGKRLRVALARCEKVLQLRRHVKVIGTVEALINTPRRVKEFLLASVDDRVFFTED